MRTTLFTVFLLTTALQFPSQAATITLDTTTPGIKISPDLYGIFFEEINRAGEGGIYAEKILNRSFEDDDKATGWSLLTDPGAQGSIRIDKTNPLNPMSPNALRLESTSTARVGVANDGFRGIDRSTYKGIALTAGDNYLASLYLRADSPVPVTLSLETPSGKVLSRQQLTGITSSWSKKDLKLTPTESATDARLAISLNQPGTIFLDVVSLFPEKTFKNRPNGMRLDLMTYLDDMKPSFVRFPGGCWVEGDSMVDAYEWKQTIGDLATRRNQHNIWRYEVTNGLGYHEYLQMCEDLVAAPMFVVNVGMAHADFTAMGRLNLKVQDALDAVEYANGDTSTIWGAVRARNGHPAPFNLKYLEIGNENGGPRYEERYPVFYKALKAKYPNLHYIANTAVKSAPVDILDEHYYSTPEFFIQNAHRYDTYDRKGPKIYVGEYAVTSGGQGNGNLRAALGEAAFMTGMERNADIVIMASYAPLFSHVHYKVWNPDAIYFDNARSCATPSFYVQQMFSANRLDSTLPAAITGAESQKPDIKGQVGLGSWLTQAEFKDIQLITGGQTLKPDLANLSQWKKSAGTWEVADGILKQTANAENAFITFGPTEPGDYTFTFKARKTAGAEGFLIPFNFINNNQTALLNLGGWGNTSTGVEFRGGGSTEPAHKNTLIETARWYDIKIEMAANTYRCFLDGEKIFEGQYAPTSPLHIVAGKSGKDILLKVVNISDTPQPTTLKIPGVRLAPSGTALQLTAESPTAENTLDNPKNVIPTPKPLTNISPNFNYTFPPHSLTILRLPTNP